jgi:aspartate aminotransferase-like enzyme
MIPHRGAAMKALYKESLALARAVHRTEGDVLTWPGTGSAGWEVAIVNLLSPGDPVLATVCGDFGDRFARAGAALGLDVRRLDVPWGQAVTPGLLRAALAANPDVRAVFLTHNETSTGLTNPLRALAAVVRDHGALAVVDAVSAAGALPLEMDAWGVDVVLSGSQKAWMCPPGLLVVAVGPRAWDAHARSRFPRFFWDLTAARKSAAEGMTPSTPPLTLLYAFHAALGLMHAEGLDRVWARHRAMGELTRKGVADLGLELFPDPGYASDTVTAVRPPDGRTAREVAAAVRAEHGIELAVGQGHLVDEVVRIGHLGWVHEPELRRALDALGATLAGRARQAAPSAVSGPSG